MQNKVLFGITGGTGCGKSTVSHIIKGMGYDVIDCDIIARQVTAEGSRCLLELREEFGDRIIAEDGSLKRRALGQMVFTDKAKLQRLNEITHKYITEAIEHMASKSQSRLVGVDGAVLFESGITSRLDKVIGVVSDRENRIKRIMARDLMTRREAENRINSQKENKFFIENCDFVLYNNGNKEQLELQVKEVVRTLEQVL